jgi:ATP synthase protein I
MGAFIVHPHLMRQADALQVKRILLVQALLGSIAVAVAWPFGGRVAISALIGSGACLLANGLFAAIVFRGYRAQEPDRLLIRMYGAEVAKLALLLGLMGVAFATLKGLNVPVLLVAYLTTQIAGHLIAAQWGARAAPRPVAGGDSPGNDSATTTGTNHSER